MANAQPLPTNAPNVFDIPLALLVRGKNVRSVEIKPDRFEEMKESLKKNGQIQPIEVIRRPDGKFDVTAGFTRTAAAEVLEWPTVRAQVVEVPTSGPMKNNPELHRMLRGLTENLAREDLTPYDQAVNFLHLKKAHDMSGTAIGQYVGRSTSYVNNLMRIAEMCEPVILDRWRKESEPQFGKDKDGKKLPNLHSVCTMDWLVDVAANVPRDQQETALKKALGLIPDEEDEDDGDDSDREPRQVGAPKRASMKLLKEALEAAAEAKKAAPKEDKERIEGVMQGLKFAIGDNKTIVRVYSPKAKKDEE